MHIRGSKGEYPYDEGKNLLVMAVQYAYADDTGTHSGGTGGPAKFCSVLGYVASPRQWKAFRRDWKVALGDVCEFHAKEFFPRAAWRSSRNPYHGWSDYQAREFLNRLLKVIDTYALKPIGGAVDIAAYMSYPLEDRHYITGAVSYIHAAWNGADVVVREKLTQHQSSPDRPYAVVMPGIFVECLEGHNDKVWVTLDDQGTWEQRAKDYYDQYKEHASNGKRLIHFGFASSADELALQAADMYAYVWNAQLHGDLKSPDLIRAFEVLTRKKKNILVLTRSYLDRLAATRGQARDAAIARIREQLT